MATTTPTVLTFTVLTIDGTPVQLTPLPTAWPSGAGCDKNIYQQVAGTLVAWDPFYASALQPSASSCLPSQVVSWWSQLEGPQPTYVGLGPFACPEAYYPARTVLVGKDAQETFCCPSSYAFLTANPISHTFPSQCQSIATAGEVVSYLQILEDGSHTATSTTVVSGVTVFGVPVNGYNVMPQTSMSTTMSTVLSTSTDGPGSSAPTSSDTPSSPSASSSPNGSSGPSLGLSVGASIAAVVGLIAIAIGAFLFWRRRRRRQKSLAVQDAVVDRNVQQGPVDNRSHELEWSGSPKVYELHENGR